MFPALSAIQVWPHAVRERIEIVRLAKVTLGPVPSVT
jgi:hypothetical protein